jgi:hypothetical protein
MGPLVEARNRYTRTIRNSYAGAHDGVLAGDHGIAVLLNNGDAKPAKRTNRRISGIRRPIMVLLVPSGDA